jgi:nucleoside 2-deoxyribosyltransferase
MNKIYIASPFFNDAQLAHVKEIEEHLNRRNIKFYSPRSVGVLNEIPEEENEIASKIIFDENVRAMNECTHVVANISKYNGSRDSGTLFEVGHFSAQKKPVVLFCDNINEMSVMLSESANSVTSQIHKIADCLLGFHCERSLIQKRN